MPNDFPFPSSRFPYTNYEATNMDWLCNVYNELQEKIDNGELTGPQGPQGNPADPALVASAVDDYLDDNITQETGYVLDRSLTMANAAAPADLVGDLKSALDEAIEDFAVPTQEAVDNWLNAHPEATTTVQDGSLTEVKFSDSLKLKTIKDYVTPEMFGASGDGVTNDTVYIQQAINSGIPVYLSKTYSCNELTVGNGAVLFGSGVIKARTEVVHGLLKIHNASDVEIAGLTFEGLSSATSNAHSAISVKNVTDVIISNCSFNYFSGRGILSYDSGYNENIIIKDCRFNYTVASGIEIRPVKNINITGCFFTNIEGYSSSQPAHPIYLRADGTNGDMLEDVHIHNNSFVDTGSDLYSGTYAVKVVINRSYSGSDYYGKNVKIDNNIIKWNGAIQLSNCENTEINDNTVSITGENAYTLILIENCLSTLIHSNDITSNSGILTSPKRYCVNANSCNDLEIYENKMFSAYGVCVFIAGVSGNINIKNNDFSQNDEDTYYCVDFSNDGTLLKLYIINNIFSIPLRALAFNRHTINNLMIVGNTFIGSPDRTTYGIAKGSAAITEYVIGQNVFIDAIGNTTDDKVLNYVSGS